jgi:prolyl-tRNA editing enzyme YbaK/EbsC (Cys-tRNA(Pro) deacylase)
VEEARALGLPPHEVAKTIVVSAGGHTVRVVLPASSDSTCTSCASGWGKELDLVALAGERVADVCLD